MSQGFARKRGKTWTYYAEAPDPATGERRRTTKGGFKTKREALDALDEIKTGLKDHGFIQPRKMTVKAFVLDEWLPTVSKRPTTVSSYRMLLEHYVVPHIGELTLTQLTAAHVRNMADLLSEKGGRNDRPLSARTVNYTLTVLRMALSYAVSEGCLLRNPATGVSGPHRARKEIETWTGAEAGQFLDAVSDDRLYAAWLLLLTRGPRRGEVCGLRWCDVDLDAGRMSIVVTRILVDGKERDSTPKTNAGRRTVPLDQALVATLKAHRRQQLEERMKWGPAWTDSGRVFTTEDGKTLHPEYLSRTFEIRARDAGLRLISLHATRHTAATLRVERRHRHRIRQRVARPLQRCHHAGHVPARHAVAVRGPSGEAHNARARASLERSGYNPVTSRALDANQRLSKESLTCTYVDTRSKSALFTRVFRAIARRHMP